MANVTVFARGPTTKVTATIVIKDFVEELAKAPGENFDSDDFLVREAQMRVRVYPNGYDGHRGYVEAYLGNMGQEEVKVKAHCSTLEQTLIGTLPAREGTLGAGGWWCLNGLLTHAECRELYKDRDFVLTLEVEMEGEKVKVVGDAPAPRQQKSLRQEVNEKAYQEMAWTDFTLEFEGGEVACHKVILAGASPVLAAMFRNEHREAAEGRAVLKLPAAIGKAFVRFMYLEEVEEGLLEQEVVAFLELGEQYQVNKLKELAEDRMLNSLKKENMIEFLLAADMFRAPRVRAAALERARASRAWLRGVGREALGRLSQDLLIELF